MNVMIAFATKKLCQILQKNSIDSFYFIDYYKVKECKKNNFPKKVKRSMSNPLLKLCGTKKMTKATGKNPLSHLTSICTVNN